MTDHSAIIDRLREAADRIDVDLTLDDVLSPTISSVDPHAATRRRLVPAAFALLLVVGLAVLLARRGAESVVPPASAWTPPISAPVGAPVPGAFAPHVADPPAWLGEMSPGRRAGGLRTGRWVSTAFGRPTTEGFTVPVTVSAFAGGWAALDDARAVEIDGIAYTTVSIRGWTALASTGEPVLVAHGNVDPRLLHEFLGATHVSASGDAFTIAVDRLPSGYAEIVAPHVLATDVATRRTLAEAGGRLAVNEVSDWADPLLYAASTGADITRQDLGTTTGWSGTATANPSGPITFVVWEPRPGVLFEIDSTDATRSVDDLVELAASTTAVAADDWDALHPG